MATHDVLSRLETARSINDWNTAELLAVRLTESGSIPGINHIIQVQKALRQRNFPDAKSALRLAVTEIPLNPEVILLRGWAAVDEGQYESGLKDLETLDFNAALALPYSNLMNAFATQKFISYSLILDGLLAKGKCYEKASSYQQALDIYEGLIAASVQIRTNSPSKQLSVPQQKNVNEALVRSALTNVKLGNTSQMIAAFRRCARHSATLSAEQRAAALGALSVLLMSSLPNDGILPVSRDPLIGDLPHSGVQIPTDLLSEAVLCLLLLEDTVRSLEATISPKSSVLYDYIALAGSRAHETELITDSHERAMAHVADNQHQARQFCLLLVCEGRYRRALTVLREVIKEHPKDALCCLLAAKVCLQLPDMARDAVVFAHQAITSGCEEPMLSNAYHALGLGCAALVASLRTPEECGVMQQKAISCLQKALEYQPGNQQILFHTALMFAEIRDIPSASTFIHQAMEASGQSAECYNLIALLLTCENHFDRALQICKIGLTEHPHDIELLVTTAKIHAAAPEQTEEKRESVIRTYKQALGILRKHRPSHIDGQMDNAVTDNQQQFFVDNNGVEDQVTYAAQFLEARVWLEFVEYLISIHLLESADAALVNARDSLGGFVSADLFYALGRYSEAMNDIAAAKGHYKRALTVDLRHSRSLLQLGGLHFHEEDYGGAQAYLMEAVAWDHTNHQAWFLLGSTQRKLGQDASAGDSLLLSVELEATAPVRSFGIFARSLGI